MTGPAEAGQGPERQGSPRPGPRSPWCSVACTMIGGSTFGSTCPIRMVRWPRPGTGPPRCNPQCRPPASRPAATRTKTGTAEMPMAIIAFCRLGPRKAASAIASTRKGQASSASVEARDHHVDDAAEIAGHQTEAGGRPAPRPSTETKPAASERLRAEDDARQHVPAEIVGAEPVCRTGGRADRHPVRTRSDRRARSRAQTPPARRRTE